MKRMLTIGAFAGIGLMLVLLVHSGIADVTQAVMRVGWTGLGLMALVRCVLFAPCALAWWLLSSRRTGRGIFVRASWVRAAIAELFISPPLASEAAGMRILTNGGMRLVDAAACTVVDLTLDLGSQAAFAITGLLFLFLNFPAFPWLLQGLAASLLAAAAIAGFALAQKGGLFCWLEDRLARWSSGRLAASRLSMQGMHERVVEIYQRRRHLVAAFFLQYAVWMTGTIPTWIGLSFLGHPLAWQQVIAMDAVVFALRAAAFMLPAGVGVQEGAYMLLGQLFGLDAVSALALSLARRAADWLATFPALLVWQAGEGRRLRRACRPAQE